MQRRSAGRGIEHSEFNASTTEPLRLLQIWFFPAERDGAAISGEELLVLRARGGEAELLLFDLP